MIEQAEQLARQRGCCKLTLEVLSKNHAAKQAYLGSGFTPYQLDQQHGVAEFWHKRVRDELGIAGNDAETIKELFSQGYQGSRYSFGYPACPDLGEQVGIARLLQPERIGVELGETFQWHPEQTTSAIVVHHPEARYFVVK